MRYYYRFREAEAEHQAYANAERDDRRGDRFDHRRGNSNGRAQNSAHAGGRTEQVANGGPRQTKPAPIQRELRFREGGSLLADEKHPSSPFRKLESSGDISENDEKNPDIIPQQITGSCFERSII